MQHWFILSAALVVGPFTETECQRTKALLFKGFAARVH